MVTLYHGSNAAEIEFPRLGNGEAHGRAAGAVVGIFSAAFSPEVAREYGEIVYAFELEEAGDEVLLESYSELEWLAEEGNLPPVAVIKHWAGDEVAITDLSRIQNWRRL